MAAEDSSDYQRRPQDFERLVRKVQQLEQQQRVMSQHLFKNAGMSVSEDGLTIGSELLVTGNTRIEGTLDLPAGIIGNDDLANPLEDGAIGYSETAFTVPTSLSAIVTRTIAIPSGFTRASVLGIASVGAFNPTAAVDYLYARTSINGSGGATVPVRAAAGSYATVTVSAIRTLTGLSGGTLPVTIDCYAAGSWGSSASNIANIDVIALFRR